MRISQTFANRFGAGFIAIGVAIFTCLSLSDRSDPDYAPPGFVMAVDLGIWMVAAGLVVLISPRITKFVGARVPWLGLCLVTLGIVKLFILDHWSSEWWQAYYLEGVRLPIVARGNFPIIGLSALSIGLLLCIHFIISRTIRAEDQLPVR